MSCWNMENIRLSVNVLKSVKPYISDFCFYTLKPFTPGNCQYCLSLIHKKVQECRDQKPLGIILLLGMTCKPFRSPYKHPLVRYLRCTLLDLQMYHWASHLSDKMCQNLHINCNITSKIILLYENKTENHMPFKHLSNNSVASGTWALITVGIFIPSLFFEKFKRALSVHAILKRSWHTWMGRKLALRPVSWALLALSLQWSSCFSFLFCYTRYSAA